MRAKLGAMFDFRKLDCSVDRGISTPPRSDVNLRTMTSHVYYDYDKITFTVLRAVYNEMGALLTSGKDHGHVNDKQPVCTTICYYSMKYCGV